jgi:hypothetical protein
MRHGSGDRRDRGQAVPLVALVMVVMVAGTLLVGGVGARSADRARARTAADAAALAGAVTGRADAERLAEANGGAVIGYRHHGAEVEVDVTVGQATATARARREVG